MFATAGKSYITSGLLIQKGLFNECLESKWIELTSHTALSFFKQTTHGGEELGLAEQLEGVVSSCSANAEQQIRGAEIFQSHHSASGAQAHGHHEKHDAKFLLLVF